MNLRDGARRLALRLVVCSALLAGVAHSQDKINLDDVYYDQTHCLTAPDMRGDNDRPISCFCRDAIVDARYVYSEYLLSGKDGNLRGPYLTLVRAISDQCGIEGDAALQRAQSKNWIWDGPEVVRVFPPDDVIKRIPPEPGQKTVMRRVPYTVQLAYRDASGRVTRTENYSSRELGNLCAGA
jgi:hypothetical protein